MSAGALRNLVIGLGILILLAFAAVVWGIVGSSDLNSNIAKELQGLSLGLPGGCEIRSAQSAGDHLTIVTSGPAAFQDACMRVFVVDTGTGEIQAEIRR